MSDLLEYPRGRYYAPGLDGEALVSEAPVRFHGFVARNTDTENDGQLILKSTAQDPDVLYATWDVPKGTTLSKVQPFWAEGGLVVEVGSADAMEVAVFYVPNERPAL